MKGDDFDKDENGFVKTVENETKKNFFVENSIVFFLYFLVITITTAYFFGKFFKKDKSDPKLELESL